MEKPKLNFAHVCDFAFNSENGKLGLVGIFKNIVIRDPSQPHPQMFIVTNVSVETGKEHEQIIRLVKEDRQDDDVIPKLSFTFSAPESQDFAEVGFIGQLNNIIFKESGNYLFKISLDKRLLGELKISVTVNQLSK